MPDGYGELLSAVKARVRTAQIRAGLAANRELLTLYWDIGSMVLGRQRAEGWGAKVIDRLSRDLQAAFPGQQGFSPRNLKYMRDLCRGLAGPGICAAACCTNSLDPSLHAPGQGGDPGRPPLVCR